MPLLTNHFIHNHSMNFNEFLITAIPLVVVVFSVVLHEIGHGYAALKLGDTTAQGLGRLTLNPIPHIDPIYTVILPLVLHFSGSPVVFGAAKPVPINPYRFDSVSPRKGMMLVAAAGPAVNFALAAFAMAILHLLGWQNSDMVITFLLQMVFINSILGLFNLLPIPPLDGSKVLAGFLPKAMADQFMRIERFGFIILFAVLLTGIHRPFIDVGIKIIFQLLPMKG